MKILDHRKTENGTLKYIHVFVSVLEKCSVEFDHVLLT